MNTQQHTLAREISCTGIGLHTGAPVSLRLSPGAPGSGIVFRRADIAGPQGFIPASYALVTETTLGTTLANAQGASVATIEHLMAALWGAGVDNALITLDGPEVPIMDGSSAPFMDLLAEAGLARQSQPRRWLRILKPVEVRDGASTARLSPNDEGDEGTVLDIEIDFAHPLINRQRAEFDFREASFSETLAKARTFGFEHEVEAMRKMGLARGGSLENAIVLSRDAMLNEEALRYDNEFLRHKALDCLGDLFLAGGRIDGRITASRPGHRINNLLLRALFADETAYAWVRADGKAALPVTLHTSPRAVAYA